MKTRTFVGAGVFVLAGLFVSGALAQDDDFSLAMVIKSTTNPYYNATLAGAKMAAEEIGGTVENYGPTQSSATAQVDIINNLADRHIAGDRRSRRAIPTPSLPAMKRAQKLGAKVITFDADSAPDARPFLVNMATTDSVGRFGAKRLAEELGNKGKVAIVSAQPTAANQNAWIAAFRDELKKPEYAGHRGRRRGLWQRQRAEGVRRDGRADHEVSRSRRHLCADLPGPARGRARA